MRFRDQCSDQEAWATGKQRNPITKQRFKENYLQMTLDPPDFQRVTCWVGALLSPSSAAVAGPWSPLAILLPPADWLVPCR